MLIDIVAKETETIMNNFWTTKLNNNLNHLIYYEDECQNTYIMVIYNIIYNNMVIPLTNYR